VVVVADDPRDPGVNDRVQLAEAGRSSASHQRAVARLGVTMLDPERTYIDSTVELAPT
jgi:bifunctional N-acetylglucosamine-1-phosphate-uridyltransferase/glucosamine-1-phosphate-acetyltransferase GlmU-like protein